jgi:enoyl-CoA hydratase
MGESLDAEGAVRHGLAWRSVPETALEEEARRLARRAAGRDPVLVARTKASLRASLGPVTVEEAAALELAAQEWSMARPEFEDTVRRLKASIERRGPGSRPPA